MTRDPRFTDRAGRRRGLLRRADYLAQVQIGLCRALTKDEYKAAMKARLDHVSPSAFLASMKQRPYDELRALGFEESETGGGCTALQRTYEDGSYHLITMENDPMAPDADTPDNEKVRVGLFNDGEFEPSADDFVDELWSVAATFRQLASAEECPCLSGEPDKCAVHNPGGKRFFP